MKKMAKPYKVIKSVLIGVACLTGLGASAAQAHGGESVVPYIAAGVVASILLHNSHGHSHTYRYQRKRYHHGHHGHGHNRGHGHYSHSQYGQGGHGGSHYRRSHSHDGYRHKKHRH